MQICTLWLFDFATQGIHMSPTYGTEFLPSNMGIKNIIQEVGEESSSLKLNNYSPSFVASTHFHPHLNSSLKSIMRFILTTKSPTVAFVGSNPTILIAPNPIMQRTMEPIFYVATPTPRSNCCINCCPFTCGSSLIKISSSLEFVIFQLDHILYS